MRGVARLSEPIISSRHSVENQSERRSYCAAKRVERLERHVAIANAAVVLTFTSATVVTASTGWSRTRPRRVTLMPNVLVPISVGA